MLIQWARNELKHGEENSEEESRNQGIHCTYVEERMKEENSEGVHVYDEELKRRSG